MTVRLRSLIFALFAISYAHPSNGQNCTINAGQATSLCPNQPFTLTGVSGGSASGTPVWSQVSGPTVTITNPTSLTTTVTGYSAGNTYKFRLSAKCDDGSLIYDEVVYTTYAMTVANAGPDISVCPPYASLSANTVGTGETGTWSYVGADNIVTFSPTDLHNPYPLVTLADNRSGAATLRWTITSANNGCVSTDEVVITNGGGASSVSAGPDQTLSNCYTAAQSATLNGSYAGTGTSTWTMISGPYKVVITDKNAYNTTVTGLRQGTYVFRWTVTGACANGSDEVIITVPAATKALTSTPASSVFYCDSRTSTILNAPPLQYTNETISWSNTSGAGTVVSPNTPGTQVTGLNGNTSIFTYTITNTVTGCSSGNTVTVNFIAPPTVTAASSVIAACDATGVTIPYTATGGNLTQWTLISGPAGSVLGGASGATGWTDVSGGSIAVNGLTVAGNYVIRIKNTTQNSIGSCADAYADVNIVVATSPSPSNAGTRQMLACSVTDTHLAANIPAAGTGTWSQVSGPSPATFADKTDATSLVSGLTTGVYTFRWIISGNTACPDQQSDVQVITSTATPTPANAGTNASICNGAPYTLNGNVPAANETGTWTVLPATGVTFSNVNDPHAVVNGMAANTAYTFTWTIENACSQNNATVTIITSATAGAKQATAGADQCLAQNITSFNLAGNAPTNGETGTWSLVSGPNATINDASQYNTTVTSAQPGNYLFVWTLAQNTCTPTHDTVAITIADATSAATAGTDQTLCGQNTISLSGNTPAAGTGSWTQTEGPGGAIITDPSAGNTTVTNVTDGRYTFRWTITNGVCATETDDIKVDFYSAPTVANAGNDIEVCNSTIVNLNGNLPTNGRGTWSIISGPADALITTPSDPTSTFANLKNGTYVLRWSITGTGNCPASTDDVSVTVVQSAGVPTGNQSLCNVNATTLTGNENSNGIWSQTSGAAATINTTAGNTAIASNLAPGTYKFLYTIAATANCPATSREITVINSEPASAANAGNNFTICLAAGQSSGSVRLNGVQPSVGIGTWTTQELPAGASLPAFSNPNDPRVTISGLTDGLYVFKWTVANGHCSINGDVVRVIVSGRPSLINAGPDQVNGCSQNIVMAATEPEMGIGTWRSISGPNTPTFDVPNAANTKVLNTVPGTYIFRWTFSNNTSCGSYSDEVQIDVSSLPATTANGNMAGSSLNICNTNGSGGAFMTMIGKNPGPSETGQWSFVNPSGGAVISSPTTSFTSISGLQGGTHQLVWAITNGSCVSSDTLTINIADQPTTADAGVNISACLSQPIALNAQPATTGIGQWAYVSGPSTPVFSNANLHNTNVTGLVAGLYNFKWTTSNGVCATSASYTELTVEDCGITIAKTAGTPVQSADGSYLVTFTFTITTPANTGVFNTVVTDDLRHVFDGAQSFAVQSVTASPGLTGSINNGFNGTTDINLLINGVILYPGSTETITLVVKVNLN